MAIEAVVIQGIARIRPSNFLGGVLDGKHYETAGIRDGYEGGLAILLNRKEGNLPFRQMVFRVDDDIVDVYVILVQVVKIHIDRNSFGVDFNIVVDYMVHSIGDTCIHVMNVKGLRQIGEARETSLMVRIRMDVLHDIILLIHIVDIIVDILSFKRVRMNVQIRRGRTKKKGRDNIFRSIIHRPNILVHCIYLYGVGVSQGI